jgi:hypothetical protein
MRWQSATIARAVQAIIDSFDDAPPINADVRYLLQRTYYRREQFGGGGAGLVTMILRCILESAGNADAIAEPAIIEAVSTCVSSGLPQDMRLLEAFDQLNLLSILNTMRSLNLFQETSLGHYMGMSLRNKLAAILELPVDKPKPTKKRAGPRWIRPPGISDEAWAGVIATRRARTNELERARWAARRPARPTERIAP